jgi:large subunit ribosomal protein L22
MEKEFKATQKYLLMSPRKVRLVVGVIKKMKPAEAVEKLPFVQKRAGIEVSKVIKSAIASAKNAGISDTDLVFKEIQVGEGPRLKRGRAASRGMWHPFKRRMSHIRVVLTTLNKDSKADKQMTNKQISNGEAKKEVKTEKKEIKK